LMVLELRFGTSRGLNHNVEGFRVPAEHGQFRDIPGSHLLVSSQDRRTEPGKEVALPRNRATRNTLESNVPVVRSATQCN
jgi:hypothetical protein